MDRHLHGVAAGGLEQRGAFDQSLHFDLEVDFARLTGWSALEGLTGVVGVRYRDGVNINNFVGASITFNPSTYQSGKQWRLMPFFLTYTIPELFGVKDFLTLSGGWVNPYDIFAQQRDSKFFRNNAIVSSKGISANGVGWSSGYAAWGGYVKIKPAKWYYAQAGLFLAIPNANNTANHGLDFQGARPADQNGLYFIAETGVTPQIGRSQLPGKYVLGGYYWGLENTSFFGQPFDGKFWLLLASGSDALTRAFTRSCGRERWRRKDLHSGGALEAQAQRPRVALVLVLQFRASLQ